MANRWGNRIDAFELWCWRRLLRVPWTARRSNQSILKEISPECSLEGLMLKLNLQYSGHPMRRADSLEKTDAGRDWGQEEKRTTKDEMAGWHQWLDERESEWTLGFGDGQGGLACCDSWGRRELDMTEQLNKSRRRKDNRESTKGIYEEINIWEMIWQFQLYKGWASQVWDSQVSMFKSQTETSGGYKAL